MQAFHETRRYAIRSCSTRDRIRTDQGLWLADLEPLPDAGEGDIVVVPGMPFAATSRIDRAAIKWLKTSAARGAEIASVCTGAFVLGYAGLLDGRRCTTHWSRTAELARLFPAARVLTKRLFVSDGAVTTSAGIASGIDMALAIIERRDGPLAAAQVAREMVVYIRRDGAHDQQSVYLDYRTHLQPGIHRVQDVLTRNPAEKTSLVGLASLAGMSTRNLTRIFRQATGISIKEFATRVRLELARSLLHDPTTTIDAVANACGFESARQFRRVWSAAHGAPPSVTMRGA
jgi:transcriptional regulator GlxA family with amidase domain